MIKSVHYYNFKSIRRATLPLGRFTLIVGANGSGKSSAMEAFDFVLQRNAGPFERYISVEFRELKEATVSIRMIWSEDAIEYEGGLELEKKGNSTLVKRLNENSVYVHSLNQALWGFRIFAFDAEKLSAPVDTNPNPELGSDGSNLAAVLDALRDSHPEKFEELNKEFHRCLPEFDRILFRTPERGKKIFMVRSTVGKYVFNAHDLSQGVLFTLAFLTLAYLPKPPSIVCFEEPDRGIHPRLLIDIRDAMYRLAFPENYGETRKPVQVIATTHSPYLLDLYKEHPEQIVIAHKNEHGTQFERLSDKPHLSEILEGAPLGEVWYSGVLGGVPSTP